MLPMRPTLTCRRTARRSSNSSKPPWRNGRAWRSWGDADGHLCIRVASKIAGPSRIPITRLHAHRSRKTSFAEPRSTADATELGESERRRRRSAIGRVLPVGPPPRTSSVVDVLVLLDLTRIGAWLSRAYRIALGRVAGAAGQNAQKYCARHLEYEVSRTTGLTAGLGRILPHPHRHRRARYGPSASREADRRQSY